MGNWTRPAISSAIRSGSLRVSPSHAHFLPKLSEVVDAGIEDLSLLRRYLLHPLDTRAHIYCQALYDYPWFQYLCKAVRLNGFLLTVGLLVDVVIGNIILSVKEKLY